MATFNCQCGCELENGRGGDQLFIFMESEILAATRQNKEITLSEFLVGWRYWALRDNANVMYWGCPECGRVYEAEPRPDGEVFRVFERVEREDEVDLTALAAWERIFVLSSDFVAACEQLVGSQSLFDIIYATRWDYDLFLPPDEKFLLALKAATNESAFLYEDVDKRDAS